MTGEVRGLEGCARLTSARATQATVLTVLSLLAGGCTIQALQHFPALAFAGAPIRLKVARIVTIDAFRPGNDPAEIDRSFPLPPDRAALDWGNRQLVAAVPASSLSARFTVTDGRATEALPPPSILAPREALLQVRSDAGVAAVLEIIDGAGRSLASVELQAADSRSVSESATAEDRRRTWYRLTQDVMSRFETDAASHIQTELAEFVE